jgi:hypothetical protein
MFIGKGIVSVLLVVGMGLMVYHAYDQLCGKHIRKMKEQERNNPLIGMVALS